MGRNGKCVLRFESAMLHEPKSLRCKDFGFLFAHKYHQTYHCCVLDSCREGRAALPLDSCFLILADEPFQLVCGLLTHVGIAMTVHV